MAEAISPTALNPDYFVPRSEVYRTTPSRRVISVIKFETIYWYTGHPEGFSEERNFLVEEGMVTSRTIARFEDTLDELTRSKLASKAERTPDEYYEKDHVKAEATLFTPDGRLKLAVDIDEGEQRELYEARFSHMHDHRGWRIWFNEIFATRRLLIEAEDYQTFESFTLPVTEFSYALQLGGFGKTLELTNDRGRLLWDSVPPSPHAEAMPRVLSSFINTKVKSMSTKAPIGAPSMISERSVKGVIRRMNQAWLNPPENWSVI